MIFDAAMIHQNSFSKNVESLRLPSRDSRQIKSRLTEQLLTRFPSPRLLVCRWMTISPALLDRMAIHAGCHLDKLYPRPIQTDERDIAFPRGNYSARSSRPVALNNAQETPRNKVWVIERTPRRERTSRESVRERDSWRWLSGEGAPRSIDFQRFPLVSSLVSRDYKRHR